MTPGAAAEKTVCNGLELLTENIHVEFGTHTIKCNQMHYFIYDKRVFSAE